MDDFLHNLRSGKLKQSERQNRPYGDQQFKGGQRRNMPDRRKREGDNKEVFERLQGIKEVLETLSATQKRMTDAYIERNRTEVRKAKAMEVLAENIYRMLNPNAEYPGPLFTTEPAVPTPAEKEPRATKQSDTPAEPEPEAVETIAALETDETVAVFETDEGEEAVEMAAGTIETESVASRKDGQDDAAEEHTGKAAAGRLTEIDRHTLFAVINQMRSEGNNWESIARHIASQGYPTVSGKGLWRGVMVKNLFEKMAEA
ncbi:MAG: hypothetical protein KFF50_12850 [Desulfatitalea sp.]|nr:hypothetical protein [Desulfatitalea sp.]